MTYYTDLVMAALAFPTLMFIIWAIKQNGRWSDTFNLLFRRSRCVKVNFHLASGRNVERYIIPDSQGWMRIGDGVYRYHKEFAEINQRYRIPEVSVLESQIAPASPALGMSKIDMQVANEDGIVTEKEVLAPTYFLTYRNQAPKRLNELWAQEVARFADSNIVADITTATAQIMKRIEWTFYIAIGIFALVAISMVLNSTGIAGIQERLDNFVTVVATRGN